MNGIQSQQNFAPVTFQECCRNWLIQVYWSFGCRIIMFIFVYFTYLWFYCWYSITVRAATPTDKQLLHKVTMIWQNASSRRYESLPVDYPPAVTPTSQWYGCILFRWKVKRVISLSPFHLNGRSSGEPGLTSLLWRSSAVVASFVART